MYTAINWAMDLGFYAGFSALTCALWWILGRAPTASACATVVSPRTPPPTTPRPTVRNTLT